MQAVRYCVCAIVKGLDYLFALFQSLSLSFNKYQNKTTKWLAGNQLVLS